SATSRLAGIAFVALRRARFGWGWALAIIMLAAGMLGDLQTVALGVAPIAIAGVVTMLRSRQWRAGAPAVSAAACSLALAEIVRHVARLIGTFTIAPANPRASLHQMLQNLHHVITYGAALEGVGYHPFGAQSVPLILELAHGVGLLLGLTALVMALVSIVRSSVTSDRLAPVSAEEQECRRESFFLEDVLFFAFCAGCAVFVWLSFSASGAFGRYLSSAVIFGSILGARLVGRIAERLTTTGPRLATGALAVLVLAGYVATCAMVVTSAPVKQPAVALTTYLEDHHLTHGIGDYWSSSIVTVESADTVVIRPVIALPGGAHLARYMRQTSSQWYDGRFEFLVYDLSSPWGSVGARSAEASFGPPRHIARVGTYRVLTWAHELAIEPDGSYARQPG
ncbi:MAG: hypothetical protein ACLPQS_08355, partial [Acidimicrobiales bacterium]